MKSHLSLKSVSVAILMFAVTVAMHEAARADGGQGRDQFSLTGNQTGSEAQGGTLAHPTGLRTIHSFDNLAAIQVTASRHTRAFRCCIAAGDAAEDVTEAISGGHT
jgi:hypothetical protein